MTEQHLYLIFQNDAQFLLWNINFGNGNILTQIIYVKHMQELVKWT